MKELDVRIVRLDPMLMASAYGFGPSPEEVAWGKLFEYMKDKGMAVSGARYFGFNNPSPAPGSPNYGYEQWVVVPRGSEPAGETRLVAFGGGLYAVTRTTLAEIGQKWQELSEWRERSNYRAAHHQWLEEMVSDPDLSLPFEQIELDLYLPIAE